MSTLSTMSITHAVRVDSFDRPAPIVRANHAFDDAKPSVIASLLVSVVAGAGSLLHAVAVDPPGASGVLAVH